MTDNDLHGERDEDLAGRVKSGSKAGFEELVNRYSSRLYHYLYPKMQNSQDVEDLVQETFLKAYKNIEKFDKKYKFSTWIYTIATRLAISHMRKLRPLESPVDNIKSDANPQNKWLQEEERSRLWHWAKKLPKLQYQALWLRYIEELSIKEMGRVMKKSQIYIRVLLHRARLKLSEMVPQKIISTDNRVSQPADGSLTYQAEGE